MLAVTLNDVKHDEPRISIDRRISRFDEIEKMMNQFVMYNINQKFMFDKENTISRFNGDRTQFHSSECRTID
jgi:hypothetical protein